MYRLLYLEQLAQASGHSRVRDEYDADRHDVRLRSLRLVTVLLTIFYFSYTAVDAWLLPDIAHRSFALRFSIVAPLAAFLFVIYRKSISIRYKELASIIVVCIATAVWCAILLGTENPDVRRYFYAILIFQLVITIVLTPPFEYSVWASLFVMACAYTTIWFLPSATTTYFFHHFAVGLPTTVLTLIASYRFSSESLRLYLQNRDTERLRAELAERNAELERLSTIDPLTGLANRRALTKQASGLGTDNERASVILVDVDHFKAFNDEYGHTAGDGCLRAVAHAIRDACTLNDLACRFGGEEFLILRPQGTYENTLALAKSIRQNVVELAIPHSGSSYGTVTVSVGISSRIVSDRTALDVLIRDADDQLYAAKRGGRNRVHCAETHERDDQPASGPNPGPPAVSSTMISDPRRIGA